MYTNLLYTQAAAMDKVNVATGSSFSSLISFAEKSHSVSWEADRFFLEMSWAAEISYE